MTYNVFGGTLSLTQSINQSVLETDHMMILVLASVRLILISNSRCERISYSLNSVSQSVFVRVA